MEWNILFKRKLKVENFKNKQYKMDNVSETILNYLDMKTTGALLLTGDWGSGKTYHLKNCVLPLIESQSKYIPIMVSLYGETDKNNIANKILFAFFDKKGKNVNLSTGTIAKNIKNFSEGFPILKKYIDLDKLVVGTGENIFKLLPHDNLFICFDDVERMSEKIDVNDFLGIVNDLVENKGCKVLLITNEEKMKNDISFKEKTIEKTILYSPEISVIFDSIIGSYEDSPFKEHLKSNKDFFISTLNPIIGNTEEEELKKSFSNIRSLKFALEHFRQAYLLLTSEKNENDDLTKQQLKSLWLFTFSISIEYRKPQNISFREKKKLDVQVTSFTEINSDNFNSLNNEKKPVENEWSYSENFKRLYYARLSANYVYFPSIYDLITSGKKIQKDKFIAHLEERFNVKEGKENPAHKLLNTILQSGYWIYSDNEFKNVLNSLFEYCKKAEFENILSYLNAGTYLVNFNEIIAKEKEDILLTLKEGINVFLSRVELDDSFKYSFEFFQENFNEPHIQQVVAHIKEKIIEIEAQNEIVEIQELESEFSDDLESFIKRFFPGDYVIKNSDKPLLHKFNNQRVRESLKKMHPKDIIKIMSFLKMRYLEASFDKKLKEEIAFLNNLETGINEIDLNEKTLSNHLLQKNLLPTIKKCQIKLQVN